MKLAEKQHKHVHLCPSCGWRIVCDAVCAIDPTLGTTLGNLPHGATIECSECVAALHRAIVGEPQPDPQPGSLALAYLHREVAR